MAEIVYNRDDYLGWKMEIENNGGFNNQVYEKFKSRVKDKKGLKIIDIGTGIGGLIERLIRLNTFDYSHNFIGIDINETNLKKGFENFRWLANTLGYEISENRINDNAIFNINFSKDKIDHNIRFYETSVYNADKILIISAKRRIL